MKLWGRLLGLWGKVRGCEGWQIDRWDMDDEFLTAASLSNRRLRNNSIFSARESLKKALMVSRYSPTLGVIYFLKNKKYENK